MNRHSAPPVALVPAAGSATRMGTLPGSKELLLLPARGRQGEALLVTPLEQALDEVATCGIDRALVLLRRGKWDIPDYLTRRRHGLPRLAYVLLDGTRSLVETLLSAEAFTGSSPVLLVLPDLVLSPRGSLAPLLSTLAQTRADLALGVFPTANPEQADIVCSRPDGVVERIQVKCARPAGRMAWATAAWAPALWDHLRRCWANRAGDDHELHLGHAFQAAIDAGCRVRSLCFRDGGFLDLGTPSGVLAALQPSRRCE